MAVEVGDAAPDFELKDQHGAPVRLSDFQGKKTVVLVFYPLAFSGVCTGELCAIRDELPTLGGDDVQVLAISVDSMFSHRAWAEQENYEFPLLSDFWPHGAVAKSYGIFDEERGVATRGTYIIDKTGVVRWKVENAIPDARDLDEYRKALADIS
ncbi:peroxiredoxin [Actinoallomurus rhizosphaericola]|uniref:peroxiredoxin n=1 Tax=Actinoallomurus rhizosphaericola TaxID=2952536 RepID=UPI0020913D2F|nr:peroxiredoxin [Actinoallomurus rhizosphaericola]MCO5993614.1 peroxiredoxin [Actinoallomurus rhizosphaericola]